VPGVASKTTDLLFRADDDGVQPFMLESSGIRGDFVRLGAVADHILTRHAYPAPVAALLGEALTLTAMLASMLKYDGVFTLQAKGDGPVGTIVADITSEGDLRGFVGFKDAALGRALASMAQSGENAAEALPTLLGQGYLAFTVDQGAHTERYQGIVELTGRNLAECLRHYFRQSEQIQTGLIVAVDRVDGAWRAAGIVLQRIPEDRRAGGQVAEPVDEEVWRRTMILLASCTRSELLDPRLPMNDLLYRLFHEEGVRVFQRRPVAARCRCSQSRLEATLRALPRDEVEALRENGKVVVTCEFCNAVYRFGTDDLARIYAS
jgi:molecular chaperone Hsp33